MNMASKFKSSIQSVMGDPAIAGALGMHDVARRLARVGPHYGATLDREMPAIIKFTFPDGAELYIGEPVNLRKASDDQELFGVIAAAAPIEPNAVVMQRTVEFVKAKRLAGQD